MPKKIYTAAQFQKDAEKAVRYIVQKGKIPVLAGGTGFYLAALLGEISLPEVAPDKTLRDSLKKLSHKKLLEKLKELDPDRAETVDRYNAPRIIRAIEIAAALGNVPKQIQKKKKDLPYQTLKIGIRTDTSLLQERIETRLIARLRRGMLAEARRLHKGGLPWKRMESLGLEYRYMAHHLKGDISKEEMIETLNIKIRQYAKRQRTWFRRDKEIKWLTLSETKKVEKMVSHFLNK